MHGGKAAPNIWGRFAAAIGRVISSVFVDGALRLEVYVDDPLFVTAGPRSVRTRNFTIAMLVLALLGFPLSWSKAAIGKSVVWIGASLSLSWQTIIVSIPKDKLLELANQVDKLMGSTVVHKRGLRSFCGKLSFLAGMVPPLRPFLSMLWGVLASSSRLPSDMVYTRQCNVPLAWLKALFASVCGPLERRFPLLEAHASEGDYIATDACPWGFAGVRFADFQPIEWFATPLEEGDLRRFEAQRGDPAHNTTWEALALLVAVRLWLPGTQVLARVRSDSLSALRSMAKLASSAPALNLVARELAHDQVVGLYHIGFATHIPGIANLLSDDLSRLWAPEVHSIPKELLEVARVHPPIRDRAFWRTVIPTHRRGTKAKKRKSNSLEQP